MEAVFILQTLALVCVTIVMVIVSIQNFRSRRLMSVTFLIIVAITLTLGLLVHIEWFAAHVWLNIPVATWMCFLGYAIRPFCLYSFIILAWKDAGKLRVIGMIPLVLNVILYSSSVFLSVPWLRDLAFHYVLNDAGNELIHVRGPLNYTSHVISLAYLLFLVYVSTRTLRGKHRSDAYSIMICAAFIIAAVVVEMLGLTMGALNVTIAISSVFYYVFLLSEENRRDALTGLFDRKTFYLDLDRFGKFVTGVIQVDMNGLKEINDTEGHLAGDEALKKLARALENNMQRNMYVYRVGGDEFTVLILKGKRSPEEIAVSVRKALEDCGIPCAVGFALCGPTCDFQLASAEADKAMYEDKANFYATHKEFDRRRTPRN